MIDSPAAPSPPPSPTRGEGVEAIIAEIRAIYRDHRHQPRGRSLEKYSEAQLTAHLARLQAGAYPWMRPRPRSPRIEAE